VDYTRHQVEGICQFGAVHREYISGNFFKATIFRSRLILTPELDVVFELIKQGPPLGSMEIARKLNIHQNTALKRLKLLEEKGLIFKQGSGPRVRYTI